MATRNPDRVNAELQAWAVRGSGLSRVGLELHSNPVRVPGAAVPRGQRVWACLRLGRWGLSLAVALTAACGALLARGASADRIASAFVAVLLLAAGCSALNQVQERDDDRRLARTRNRPLPSGVLGPAPALVLAGVLLVAGFAGLVLAAANLAAAAWALAALVLYNGVYTPLKRHSALAFLPGAVAGALPPVIGAAMGGAVPSTAVVLAGTLFVWQLPHTWLVQLKHWTDYRQAPFPVFCKLFERSQLQRIVCVWCMAFAVLPAVLLQMAAGSAHPGLQTAVWCLSLVLAAVCLPFLAGERGERDYRRLEALLRVDIVVLVGLLACACRV